ncbi:MAG: phage tail assembly chaperone [Flavobacteriaceae bacterium]
MGQPTDPIVILELNLLDRTINYRNIMKTVPDQYWDDSVKPKLYPLWDTEKDRLITFRYYDNASFHCTRRKFIKNFTTNTYEWKDYEMSENDVEAAAQFYDFLKETFLNIEQLQNAEFQEELGRMYGEVRSESWLSIRLARNFLLQETDFIFTVSDAPTVSDEKKEMYKTYRQKLREIPQIFKDNAPTEVKFPMSPEGFDAVYKANNPSAVYLDTEDQWIALSNFFFSQFRDKMARYLCVRDLTDRLYNNAFIEALKATPVAMEGINHTAWGEDHENLDALKKSVDDLMAKLLEQEGG